MTTLFVNISKIITFFLISFEPTIRHTTFSRLIEKYKEKEREKARREREAIKNISNKSFRKRVKPFYSSIIAYL